MEGIKHANPGATLMHWGFPSFLRELGELPGFFCNGGEGLMGD